MDIKEARAQLYKELRDKFPNTFNYCADKNNVIILGLSSKNEEAISFIPQIYEGFGVTHEIFGKISAAKNK